VGLWNYIHLVDADGPLPGFAGIPVLNTIAKSPIATLVETFVASLLDSLLESLLESLFESLLKRIVERATHLEE
jgi:hypothetical protein